MGSLSAPGGLCNGRGLPNSDVGGAVVVLVKRIQHHVASCGPLVALEARSVTPTSTPMACFQSLSDFVQMAGDSTCVG
jgi:hypothetical protein